MIDLSDFRLLRDAYQRERRAATIGSLYEQWDALTKEMDALKAQRRERVSLGLEEDLKALSFKRQDAGCQIVAIEREMFVPYALGFMVRG